MNLKNAKNWGAGIMMALGVGAGAKGLHDFKENGADVNGMTVKGMAIMMAAGAAFGMNSKDISKRDDVDTIPNLAYEPKKKPAV